MLRFCPLLLPLLLPSLAPGQVVRHFWVDSKLGSDTNAGTRAKPFKSITRGMASATRDMTVHVMPGLYSPSKTGEKFTITISATQSNVKLLGTDAATCIIDFEKARATNNDWFFLIDSGAQNIEIANLTMTNGAFQPTVKWFAAAIWWRSVKGLDLHHCVIESCESGIYSAGGAQDVSVHDNVFIGCNIPCRFRQSAANGAKNCRFFNNLCANSTGFYSDTISPSGSDPTQVFVNNISINNKGNGFQGTILKGVVFENNLAFNNGGQGYVFGATPPSKTNLTVDPLLVDFAKGNYRLKPKSPCIEAGYAAGQPRMVNDFYGNARVTDFDGNQAAVPDIGIHEVAGIGLTVSNFVQGKTATFSVSKLQSNVVLGYLFVGLQPTSATINPFGSIGINLSPATSVLLGGIGVPGNTKTAIPKDPALDNLPVYIQAFAVDGKNTWRPSGRVDRFL